jgi:hypothetical protein
MLRHSLIASLLFTSTLAAQEQKHPYEIAREAFEKQIAAVKDAAQGNADLLVLDHVTADRKQGRVTILAVATGVAETDPVEFFVTPANSGKDYEALSVTYAKPSDVDRALRFIGLTPGRPVDYEKNLHWPRGPRVTMTFVDGDKRTPAEDCAINTEAGASLPRTGFAYVGSFPQADGQGAKPLAADVDEAKPIAPLYNDPATVLDLPRRASQGVVYGFLRANPKHAFKLGQQLAIEIEPAKGDAAVKSLDIVVETHRPTTGDGDDDAANAYEIYEGKKRLSAAADLPRLVNAIAELSKSRDDLFCIVRLDPATPVEVARKLYAVLMSVEQDRGLKLEPPPSGLFHKAFFPEPEWRKREDRLGEPWELFLYRENGKLLGRLERQSENYEPDAAERFTLHRTNVADPAAFVKEITAVASQWTKAVFIYPPADLTMGELDAWAVPALASYPRIFVFPAAGGAAQPAPPPPAP